jgi:hypothetical protein|tara:strand:+ start:555 stop:794 length:240 start_codon:yes stop_codon:yes gene_type:complete
MRVVYSLTIEAECPVDGLADGYECRVISAKTIPVEKILDAVNNLPKAFQEDVTMSLARTLRASVETVGWHSGVKTECFA